MSWLNLVDMWAVRVWCIVCEKLRLGQGAEYYDGDFCRCKRCIEAGRPMPAGYYYGKLVGIIGQDIEQYPGELSRRRERCENEARV